MPEPNLNTLSTEGTKEQMADIKESTAGASENLLFMMSLLQDLSRTLTTIISNPFFSGEAARKIGGMYQTHLTNNFEKHIKQLRESEKINDATYKILQKQGDQINKNTFRMQAFRVVAGSAAGVLMNAVKTIEALEEKAGRVGGYAPTAALPGGGYKGMMGEARQAERERAYNEMFYGSEVANRGYNARMMLMNPLMMRGMNQKQIGNISTTMAAFGETTGISNAEQIYLQLLTKYQNLSAGGGSEFLKRVYQSYSTQGIQGGKISTLLPEIMNMASQIESSGILPTTGAALSPATKLFAMTGKGIAPGDVTAIGSVLTHQLSNPTAAAQMSQMLYGDPTQTGRLWKEFQNNPQALFSKMRNSALAITMGGNVGGLGGGGMFGGMTRKKFEEGGGYTGLNLGQKGALKSIFGADDTTLQVLLKDYKGLDSQIKTLGVTLDELNASKGMQNVTDLPKDLGEGLDRLGDTMSTVKGAFSWLKNEAFGSLGDNKYAKTAIEGGGLALLTYAITKNPYAALLTNLGGNMFMGAGTPGGEGGGSTGLDPTSMLMLMLAGKGGGAAAKGSWLSRGVKGAGYLGAMYGATELIQSVSNASRGKGNVDDIFMSSMDTAAGVALASPSPIAKFIGGGWWLTKLLASAAESSPTHKKYGLFAKSGFGGPGGGLMGAGADMYAAEKSNQKIIEAGSQTDDKMKTSTEKGELGTIRVISNDGIKDVATSFLELGQQMELNIQKGGVFTGGINRL